MVVEGGQFTRGDHEPNRAFKKCPLVWPGQNFVPEARYSGTKWASFSGQNRIGPKSRLKNHFWLTQREKNRVGPSPTVGQKNSAQNSKSGSGQNDQLYNLPIKQNITIDFFKVMLGLQGPGLLRVVLPSLFSVQFSSILL